VPPSRACIAAAEPKVTAELPLSPALFVGTANAFVGLGEDLWDPSAAPQGPLVERFLRDARGRRTDDQRAPWDAAFVHYVGYWSHYDDRCERSAWPLPATASVEELAQFAGTSGTLREAPLAGDVFLLWCPTQKRFVRTGIVIQVQLLLNPSQNRGRVYTCTTIEGNSDGYSNEPGTMTMRTVRNLRPDRGDRFIRWSALDGREERREEIERELDRLSRVAAA
jgi:hypothetical protein